MIISYRETEYGLKLQTTVTIKITIKTNII